MALKAAFIFLAPDVNPAVHRAQVITPAVELTVVAAHNYAQAEQVARDLVAEGIGHEGAARIVQAVKGKAAVGVVRFDCHPGLEGKSGDALFG